MAVQRQHRYTLITELNEEWARLVSRHRDAVPWPDLSRCGDLGDVLAAIRYEPDETLRLLLRKAIDGDQLAARTVLQAMLGKVVRLAQSHPGAGIDDFVAALWCRIRTYPLQRRPSSIAANLALDTRKDVLAQLRRSDGDRVGSWRSETQLEQLLRRSPPLIPERDAADLQAEQVIEQAENLGLIDAVTSSVLRSVYVDGVSSRAAAARLGTSPGMVRYRCSRGLRELSRHALLLGDAA